MYPAVRAGLCVCFLAGFVVSGSLVGAAEFLRGDANGDGVVTLADSHSIMQ